MKVAVTIEEQSLPYYKYYERGLKQIPEKYMLQTQALPCEPDKLLPFESRNDFIKGADYDYCQSGYGIFEDGTGAVCSTIYMLGVTSEMMEWWFPWHSVGADLRYKIWDPEDHYFATAFPASKVIDPGVPVSQKTWGVDHYIMEDVGFGPQFVQIRFLRPGDVGCDENLIGSEYCSGMVAGIGQNTNTTMIHKWYPFKEGIIYKSRFWIGCGFRPDGTLGRCLPDGSSIPVEFCKAMLTHSIKEYINLSSFLPELYNEEKDNF